MGKYLIRIQLKNEFTCNRYSYLLHMLIVHAMKREDRNKPGSIEISANYKAQKIYALYEHHITTKGLYVLQITIKGF